MRRTSSGSAGEESDEEWVEEQIEREESTESLDELGLPLSSSKSSSNSRPSGTHSHFDSTNLIVLDFGPSPTGRLLRKFYHVIPYLLRQCISCYRVTVQISCFVHQHVRYGSMNTSAPVLK